MTFKEYLSELFYRVNDRLGYNIATVKSKHELENGERYSNHFWAAFLVDRHQHI